MSKCKGHSEGLRNKNEYDLRVRSKKHLLMQNFGRNMNLTSLLGYLSQIVALSFSWWVLTMTFHVLGEGAPRAKNGPFRLFSAICSNR